MYEETWFFINRLTFYSELVKIMSVTNQSVWICVYYKKIFCSYSYLSKFAPLLKFQEFSSILSNIMKRYLHSILYCNPKLLFLLIILTVYGYIRAIAGDVKYNDSWGKAGCTVDFQCSSSVTLNYSIKEFSLNDLVVNGDSMHNIVLADHFLPNDEGAPNLPFSEQYIAVPRDSEVTYNILSYRSETLSNIKVAPVLGNPIGDTASDSPEFIINQSIYSSNRFNPEEPVVLSEKGQIGGVDVVKLLITPFHYNPVTRQLIVYRDLKIEITFTGGNGFFANDIKSDRSLDPALSDLLLNYDSLLQVNVASNDSNDQEKGTNSKKKEKNKKN